MVFIPKRGTAQTLALALALRWEPLDPRDLLAFLIHPASPTGIPLKERIENATLGREALSAAAREELRLLYVGFTRARDILILATREGRPSPWLDLLGAPWLRPLEDAGTPLSGLLGPAQVPYCIRTIQPPAAIERPEAATSYC